MAEGWECACGATALAGARCTACGRTAPWYVPPPREFVPAPPPPVVRQRLGWLGTGVAVALALVLAAGLNRAVVLGDRAADRRRAAEAAEFDATVRELTAFVAEVRGRPFRYPVRVSVLGDREFDFVALAELDGEPPRPLGEQPLGTTFRALGVETRGIEEPPGPAVLGVFDEETERVFVRGTSLTPFVKSVIVHELTHAWQHQHFGLQRFDDALAAGGERGRAAEALVEGDAEHVAAQWVATQPEADQAAVRAAEARYADQSRPALMAWALEGFGYRDGPAFVAALRARGGVAALDRAFRRPPVTTEQVLHLDKYLRAERGVDVRAPRVVGEVADEGTFGEHGLAIVLARGVPDAEARAAVRGWRGDAYVTWSEGPALCLDLWIRMDTRADRERLLRALRVQLRAGEDAGQDGTDGIRARYCA